MEIDGITYLRVDEENYISSQEPPELYYKAYVTKNGVKGIGIGITSLQAIVDAIDEIESYNLKTDKFIEELSNCFPF